MELVKKYTDIEIVSKLFHARTQIHIYHLQTKSFAQHKALNEAYDDILDKTDELAETIQGKTKSLLKGYKSYPFVEDNNPIKFLTELKMCLEEYRVKLKTDWDNIDNQIQTIIDTIESTIYKLTFLE